MIKVLYKLHEVSDIRKSKYMKKGNKREKYYQFYKAFLFQNENRSQEQTSARHFCPFVPVWSSHKNTDKSSQSGIITFN